MRSCAAIAQRGLRQLPAVAPRTRPHLNLSPRPHNTSFSSAAGRNTRRMVAIEAISPVHIAIGFVGLAAVAAWVDAMLKSKKPELIYAASSFNKAVLSRCPTLHSTYQCTPFLTNGHVETIMVAKLRKPPGVDYRREIILTKDGGAVAIDWEHVDDDGKDLPADAPVLILFPGLTGGSGDSYVQHAVLQARHAGIRAAVFNSRGTADSPVITPQFYSASFTDDTREVINHVRKRYPESTLFAAGWSLGANILVNYLGEQGSDTPLEAAVSMCNPFDLTISNRYINEGFNQIYNWSLAASLKRIFMKHQLVWKGHPGPAQPQLVPTVKTIREFDEAITVHSFAWKDVDAYYAGSSSARRIPKVQIPLLCIQALDDPIAPAEAIPCDDIQANPNCVLAVTPCGGHLGWASGPGAPFNHPWSDAAVFEWLTSVHTELMQRKGQGDGNGSSSSRTAAYSKQKPGSATDVAANTGVEAAAGKRTAVVVEVTAGSSSVHQFATFAEGSSSSGHSSVPWPQPHWEQWQSVRFAAEPAGGASDNQQHQRPQGECQEQLQQQQQQSSVLIELSQLQHDNVELLANTAVSVGDDLSSATQQQVHQAADQQQQRQGAWRRETGVADAQEQLTAKARNTTALDDALAQAHLVTSQLRWAL